MRLRLMVTLMIIPLCAPAQDAREIVTRYLNLVSNGDVENWEKITSTYTESEGYYSQNAFEQKVDLLKPDKPSFSKIYSIWPQSKIESYSDSSFSNLTSEFYFLKRKTVIIIGNIPPIIKPAPPRNEFDFEFLPLMISKALHKSKSVELVGIKDFPMEGISCYEIKISTKELNVHLFINTDTYLLDFYNHREDGDLSFLNRYSNYKRISEYMIPMSEMSMHNGLIFHWVKKRKVEFNIEIDPGKFIYNDN